VASSGGRANIAIFAPVLFATASTFLTRATASALVLPGQIAVRRALNSAPDFTARSARAWSPASYSPVLSSAPTSPAVGQMMPPTPALSRNSASLTSTGTSSSAFSVQGVTSSGKGPSKTAAVPLPAKETALASMSDKSHNFFMRPIIADFTR